MYKVTYTTNRIVAGTSGFPEYRRLCLYFYEEPSVEELYNEFHTAANKLMSTPRTMTPLVEIVP